MTKCVVETASDGTKVLICYQGPGLTLGDMAELNNFVKLRREKFEAKKAKKDSKK